MILVSSDMTMVVSPADRIIVTDPEVSYRPDRIRGRRYQVTTSAPDTRDESESGGRR
ncbi:hypothetical protein [Nocardia sp. NPDC051570]|uniref:hypothetical protein n=1 Tax=Nocardia sp. NPDC051570 TaxID=3364324 RepID=UPI00378ACC68